MQRLVISLALSASLVACGGESSETDTDTTGTDTTSDTTADTTPDTTPDITAPEDTDAGDDADVGPVTCEPLSLSGLLVANDVQGAYTLGGGADLGLGGPLPDAVVIEFYSNQTGTFDLGTGGNRNYASCDQCIRIVQDIDASGGEKPRHFFQAGGTLIIDPETPPESGRVKLSLRNLEMIEVTIFADFRSEPVENGACYQGPTAIDLDTAACVPECGDHICGPDGCGGTCGDGCENGDVCALDGLACIPNEGCQALTVSGELENLTAGVYQLALGDRGLGAVGQNDFLQIEFYTRGTGTFDLGATPNDDYATCNQCVRIWLDGKKVELFQRSGKIIVSQDSDPLGDPDQPPQGALNVRFVDLVLEEIEDPEENDYHSIPIPGGLCVNLTVEGALATPPPPQP